MPVLVCVENSDEGAGNADPRRHHQVPGFAGSYWELKLTTSGPGRLSRAPGRSASPG